MSGHSSSGSNGSGNNGDKKHSLMAKAMEKAAKLRTQAGNLTSNVSEKARLLASAGGESTRNLLASSNLPSSNDVASSVSNRIAAAKQATSKISSAAADKAAIRLEKAKEEISKRSVEAKAAAKKAATRASDIKKSVVKSTSEIGGAAIDAAAKRLDQMRGSENRSSGQYSSRGSARGSDRFSSSLDVEEQARLEELARQEAEKLAARREFQAQVAARVLATVQNRIMALVNIDARPDEAMIAEAIAQASALWDRLAQHIKDDSHIKDPEVEALKSMYNDLHKSFDKKEQRKKTGADFDAIKQQCIVLIAKAMLEADESQTLVIVDLKTVPARLLPLNVDLEKIEILRTFQNDSYETLESALDNIADDLDMGYFSVLMYNALDNIENIHGEHLVKSDFDILLGHMPGLQQLIFDFALDSIEANREYIELATNLPPSAPGLKQFSAKVWIDILEKIKIHIEKLPIIEKGLGIEDTYDSKIIRETLADKRSEASNLLSRIDETIRKLNKAKDSVLSTDELMDKIHETWQIDGGNYKDLKLILTLAALSSNADTKKVDLSTRTKISGNLENGVEYRNPTLQKLLIGFVKEVFFNPTLTSTNAERVSLGNEAAVLNKQPLDTIYESRARSKSVNDVEIEPPAADKRQRRKSIGSAEQQPIESKDSLQASLESAWKKYRNKKEENLEKHRIKDNDTESDDPTQESNGSKHRSR